MALNAAAYGVVLAMTGVAFWKYFQRPARSKSLPPGPRRLPVIGNLLDMLVDGPLWFSFDRWAKEHGDVFYMETFGQKIVVLSSVKAIHDLFDRRSSLYSGRPRVVMVNELMGLDWAFSIMPYGDKWRARRRAFHPYFHPNAISQWDHTQIREVHSFLRHLLKTPDDLKRHVRHLFGATTMAIIYGISVAEDDGYITDAEIVIDLVAEAGVPGAFYVDAIPALKYVPAWFPGAGFRRKAAYCKQVVGRTINRPFEAVKDAIRQGKAIDCVTTRLLQAYPNDDDFSRDVAAVAYTAGADTTVSAVLTFFLALALHPAVQTRAQTELDRVVGPLRLPNYDDRPNLPYVNAIISEVLRWQPVGPVGAPHSLEADDEYNGFFIPAGTFVFGNTWSILHDPKEYPEPELFKPERFLTVNTHGQVKLNSAVRDPRIVAFGFGRRMCPGRHFAEKSLFAVVASVLHTLSVSPAVHDGIPIAIEVKMTPGLISHPMPFECLIKPRDVRTEALVHHSSTKDSD